MSIGSVVEADAALGHVDGWTALTDDEKQRALDTATLWLSVSYELPAAPEGAVLSALVRAEQVAARYGLVSPLFAAPQQASDGGLVKKRTKRKVDVIETEIEEQWAEPTSASSGQFSIAEVDAILRGVVERRGVSAGRFVGAL